MSDKIRMALIATYPKLAEIYLNLTDNRENIISYNVYASFEEAAKIALEMEDNLDIILSRGGTAEYIRRSVHIPVLAIPITPFDVIKAIFSLNPIPQNLALIHFRKNIRDIQAIADMFGIRIEEYTFLNQNDIQAAVTDAIKKGITTVIGGHVAVELASQKGLTAIELSAGEEATDRSIDEAISLLSQVHKEQHHNTRVKAALNALTEGIVVTDDKKNIIVINNVASNLFQKRYKKGDKAGTEILSKECLTAYASKQEQPIYIQKIRKETYSVSHIPVFRGNAFLGIVSRYENITKAKALEQKIRKEMLAKGFDAQYQFPDILTEDLHMITIRQEAEIYAMTDSAILIQGESGTGKELFAQSIHNGSTRKSGPFVAVNCAAIPPTLLESELFGYEKGAFTGAQKEGKAGFFELAHLGTLFLDEIGEVSMDVQTRLLRVLQEHEIMRVGGNKIISIDVRIISATNKNLEKEVQKGNFRRDLYYRLNILQLQIPPLRNRLDDITLLTEQFASEYQCSKEDIAELIPLFKQYHWPGNVRELRNIVERYCVLFPFLSKGKLTKDTLISALGLSKESMILPQKEIPSDKSEAENNDELTIHLPLGKSLNEIISHVEYVITQKYLELYDNNQEKAAKALGIGRTTLWRKSRLDNTDS